ncbi:MAG: hypothetical protein QXD05_01095 [Candidatus Pacearchaeota archaeon]
MEGKLQLLEKLIEKHKNKVDVLKESKIHPRSRFYDITNNIIAVMQAYVHAAINSECTLISYKKTRDVYLEYSNLLRNYLRIIESNPEIKELEIKTEKGYLKNQIGKNGYPPKDYVIKLQEFLKLKKNEYE